VEGSVAIAKYFEMDGGIADIFAIGFDSGARIGGFDQDVVSDGSVRTTFNAGRNGFTTSEQTGESCKTGKDEVIRFHISSSQVVFSSFGTGRSCGHIHLIRRF